LAQGDHQCDHGLASSHQQRGHGPPSLAIMAPGMIKRFGRSLAECVLPGTPPGSPSYSGARSGPSPSSQAQTSPAGRSKRELHLSLDRVNRPSAAERWEQAPSMRRSVFPQDPRIDRTPSIEDFRSQETQMSKETKMRKEGLDLGTWGLGDGCLHPLQACLNPAVASLGKESQKTGEVFVDRHCAREVKQPPDGSCLFHALCYGLNNGIDARRLRKEISCCINDNPEMEIADLALKDWVKMDCGRSIRKYASKMAAGAEGGGIEMEVFTRLKGVNVHVYERCHGGYLRTCCFDGAGPNAKATVNILYRKRCHYDALVLQREQAKL